MGACRESSDIWFLLKRKNLRGKLFKKRFWTNEYIWHDSFGKYFNRLIGCLLFGHRKVQNVSDYLPKEKEMHCFNCERRVDAVDDKWVVLSPEEINLMEEKIRDKYNKYAGQINIKYPPTKST